MSDREKLIRLLDEAHDEYYKICDFSRGYMDVIADHLLANGVTFATDTNDGCEWISVEERLPEPGVIVLVHSKLGCTYFSQRLYYHLEGRPFSIEYSGGWEVTHWMPIPKPPLDTTNQAADL